MRIKFWIFGQHAAGKSTLGKALVDATGAVLLDADDIRPKLWPELGFTEGDRDANILRLVHLTKMIPFATVTCAITPFEYQRQTVKALIKDIVMVHVATPQEACERRDPKGLYNKKAWLPFEEPGLQCVTVDGRQSVDQSIGVILKRIEATLG